MADDGPTEALTSEPAAAGSNEVYSPQWCSDRVPFNQTPSGATLLRGQFHSERDPKLREWAGRCSPGEVEGWLCDEDARRWIQLGLVLHPGAAIVELYRRIALEAPDLLASGRASNFFFMHKPPGLRWRVETATHQRGRLEEQLYELAEGWRTEGVIEGVVPGIYEPEYLLFGGRDSMRSVHELFTLDSLAWLEHRLGSAAAADHEADDDPAWALSLAMLQSLFAALGIVGWEDLGVWDHVRRKTGRRLSAEMTSSPEFAAMADEIRRRWRHTDLTVELSASNQRVAQGFRDSVLDIAARWRRDYFDTRRATIGPREAAAFCVIFHWNRADLSFARQALLTEALASWDTI